MNLSLHAAYRSNRVDRCSVGGGSRKQDLAAVGGPGRIAVISWVRSQAQCLFGAGNWQDRTASLPTTTVQAPHRLSPQPYLVSVSPSSVRKTHRSIRSASTFTLVGFPLSVNWIVSFIGLPFWRKLIEDRQEGQVKAQGPGGTRSHLREQFDATAPQKRTPIPHPQDLPRAACEDRCRIKGHGDSRESAGASRSNLEVEIRAGK